MVAGQRPVRLRNRLSPRSQNYLRSIEDRRRRFRFAMPLAAAAFAVSAAIGAFATRATNRNNPRSEIHVLADELPKPARDQFRKNLTNLLGNLKQQLTSIPTEPVEEERDPELDEEPFVTQEDDNRFCYIFIRNIFYDGAHVDILVMGRAPRVSILDSELTLKADLDSDLFFPNEVVPFWTFEDLHDVLLARCLRLQDRPDEFLR